MIFFGQKKDVLDHNHQNGNDKNNHNGQHQQNLPGGLKNQQHHNQNGHVQSQNHFSKQHHPKKYPVLEKIGLAVALFGSVFLICGVGVLGYGIYATLSNNLQLGLIIGGVAGIVVGLVLLLLMIPICCKIKSGSNKVRSTMHYQQKQPVRRKR